LFGGIGIAPQTPLPPFLIGVESPPNRDHGLPLLAVSQLVAERFNASLALRTAAALAVLASWLQG